MAAKGGDARRRGAEKTSRRETPDDRAARGPRQRRRHAHSCVPDHGREPRSNQHELQRPGRRPVPVAPRVRADRASTGTRHPCSSSSPLRSSPIVRYPPTPVPASTRQADRVANTEYGAIGIGTLPGSAFALYPVFRVTRYATLHSTIVIRPNSLHACVARYLSRFLYVASD